MKKNTVTNNAETTKTRIEKRASATAEKAVKNSRKTETVKIGFAYDVKSIKVDFSESLKNELSAYYASRFHLATVCNQYRVNLAYYSEKIADLSALDTLTAEQAKTLQAYELEQAHQQACFRFFRRKMNAGIKPAMDKISESVYNAYLLKFINADAYKTALSDYFKEAYNVEMTDSLYTFIDRAIGLKSASLSKRTDKQIDAMSKGQFKTLLLDVMTQIAIDKMVLKKRVIENTISNDGEPIAIAEFVQVIEIAKPGTSATKSDYLKIMETIGLPVKPSMKKADLVKMYKLAKDSKMFKEIA